MKDKYINLNMYLHRKNIDLDDINLIVISCNSKYWRYFYDRWSQGSGSEAKKNCMLTLYLVGKKLRQKYFQGTSMKLRLDQYINTDIDKLKDNLRLMIQIKHPSFFHLNYPTLEKQLNNIRKYQDDIKVSESDGYSDLESDSD